VDRNVVRLDTENVLDVELSLSAVLVDPAKPITVVWNGVAQEMRAQDGKLELTDASYQPVAFQKSARLPGSTVDFTVTPFAVVIGTASKDKEMVALCEQKAKVFIDSWRDWQRHPPRVFKDSEISDADMARYSLLLIGGPEANRVSAKFSANLPLQISKDRITIDGKAFPVEDAVVQMIYPNPLNVERYVWIAAATSTAGMFFSELLPQRLYDWDFIIADGHVPALGQVASALQTRVVSGMFDYDWTGSDWLDQPGDAEIRAKGRRLRAPNAKLTVSPKVSGSYVGRYQIQQGPLLEVFREGAALKVRQQGAPDADLLMPTSETDWVLPKEGVWVSFVKDASGKVTGFTGYQGGNQFAGTKLE
jgi:hypothetical protein